jgi:hypothetical protein
LSPRRWRDVRDAVAFADDYPDPHHGNVVGLAERAVRWHRDQRQEIVDQTIARYGHGRPLPRPPIGLPEVPGIRFLATVGDLCQEGDDMEHCIASYAAKAMDGSAYLFHIDHDGERASIEVDWMGHVVQARGIRNQENAAAQWGRKVLARWSKGMRLKPA